jgi:putative NIF3 family GTP cyclohydrolase 1 type 2
MDLRQFVDRFESNFSLSLSEKWDNVGLLIEPSGNKSVSRIMLTNDLTEDVLEESLARKTDLIISYHPPIFRPLKRLTQNNWKVNGHNL